MLNHAKVPVLCCAVLCCLTRFFLTFDFIFQYVVSLDQGKFASLTIKGVSMEDSGRYTMIVQNKYGGESVDIVVSVTAAYHKLEDLLRAVKFFWPSVAQISSFHRGLTVSYFYERACV